MARATDKALVDKIKKARTRIITEVEKVIVGQSTVVQELLWALFARGHCLLIGVPGLAKTLLVRTIARILDLSFSRIQFTPDLMPSDITGTDIIEETRSGHRIFKFIKGPVFANIVLADEINRTPPKTQSALLEAMQEYNVTIAGKNYKLDRPFFVLATQNPIEQEGTYPLPEAQLDRFMFNIYIDYPSEREERDIVKQTTTSYEPKLRKILSKKEILALQDIVVRVPVSDFVVDYAVQLVRHSRPEQGASKFIRDNVSWGAGPRASQYLVLAGKARAVMEGRYAVSREDINVVAPAVLRHRIITNFNAEADGITPDDIVARLLKGMEDFSEPAAGSRRRKK